MTRILALVLALCAAGTAGAQMKSDWERANEERLRQSHERPIAPPMLDRARLVALQLDDAAQTEFRFYVDPASISVGEDRIVRYILVARSPSGAESVTFEGIRCPAEYRIYAVGKPDGTWGGRATEWRPIPRDPRLGQQALSRRYFCPARAAVADREEGERALRAGGHAAMQPLKH